MKYSKVCLYNSIATGDSRKTKSILNSGMKIDSKTGEWALYLAIKNNNMFAKEMLLENGAKIRPSGVTKASKKF